MPARRSDKNASTAAASQRLHSYWDARQVPLCDTTKRLVSHVFRDG
ncbi:hypothetical protein [Agreia sp. Leaf335]|nr:hypothetical protein [Agreia sp. Leaf335]